METASLIIHIVAVVVIVGLVVTYIVMEVIQANQVADVDSRLKSVETAQGATYSYEERLTYTPAVSATTTDPTLGTHTKAAIYSVKDGMMELNMYFDQTAADGVAGTGDYLWSLPSGWQFDLSGLQEGSSVVGVGYVDQAANEFPLYVVVGDASHFQLVANGTALTTAGSTSFMALNAIQYFSIQAKFPVVKV